MWSSLIEYHRPETIHKSFCLLSRQKPRTFPLAGGTWIVAQSDLQVEAVVDLSSLNLAYIKLSTRRIRIGSMTTLQALIESPSIQDLANGQLKEALSNSAPRAIRNIATLGGTIIVGNSSSEVCLTLLALNAQVVIRNPAEQAIPLNAFYANQAEYLPPTGILSQIIIPKTTADVGVGLTRVSRAPRDQPVVSAAAMVSRVGHVCRVGRLALGGISPKPVKLPEIEAMISNQRIDAALLDRVAEAVRNGSSIPPGKQSSAEYQREMAGIVVSRALREAWIRAQKE